MPKVFYGSVPVANGRFGSRIHSLHEPAYSFPPSRPATAIANNSVAGVFRPAAELRRDLLQVLDGREPQQLIAMCGSGVTACQLLLAMAVAGLEGGKLYAGSWSEWIRDPKRPFATGTEP